MNEYETRQAAARKHPRPGYERALLNMLDGWSEYAKAHKDACGSPIGDDAVLGSDWQEIGRALLCLLNGELGRFDGGTLDSSIRGTLVANGFEDE